MSNTETPDVPDVPDLAVAFGDTSHLPAMEDLPEEFQREQHPACRVARKLFFHGGTLREHGYVPRENINAGKATRAIGAVLSSFEPKHEHKIAGAGYMIDLWFERASDPNAED